MRLSAGSRLGSFEVVSVLGAGGMGEVYRARDTRLSRDVALKILPDAFEADTNRRARFEREARALAALNHPHIAQIYDVEELRSSSSAAPCLAIVMELVEGEDLAARLVRGPMPVDTAVNIARQIAGALAAAHERGIVHRDLKPANIKLRTDGTVKVLDFGLAKDAAARDGADNPTMTSAPPVTEHGITVGTPGYMSPEQATGQAVDHRTDIWAFGCVLFEMLSGRSPFRGKTSLETIADVIKSDPDWSQLSSAPAALQALVRRCLMKDARQRVQSIEDARIWLDESAAFSSATSEAQPRALLSWPLALIATLTLIAGAAAMYVIVRPRATPPPGIEQFQIMTPADQPYTGRPPGGNLAITPDGSTIIYHAVVRDTFQLVRRPLDSLTATPIAGTERAMNPTFSPDGQRIAFFADGAIKSVPLAGGTPLIVCDLPGLHPFIAWADTGDIFFVQPNQPLMKVSEKGGTPTVVLTLDPAKGEGNLFGLVAWPGGTIVTLVVPPPGGRVPRRLAALTPGATALKTIGERMGFTQYVAGKVVYLENGAIMAAPFDLDLLKITGEPVLLEKGNINGGAVASNGTIVYVEGESNANIPLPLVIAGSDGRVERVITRDAVLPRHLRVSADGRRLLVAAGLLNYGQVWIYDLQGAAQPLKLAFNGAAYLPIWAPGNSVVVASPGPGLFGVFSLIADGRVAEPASLMTFPDALPMEWSPDGTRMLYQQAVGRGGADLFEFDPASHVSRPWLQTPFNEGEASFSPNGQYVAYASDQDGRFEIWVRPYGSASPNIRVSSDGGHEPRWSRDGRQLFYQSGTRMMTATIQTLPTLSAGPPRMLFEGGFVPYNTTWRRTYDVLPDGRFVFIQQQEMPRQPITVILHALGK